MEQPPSIEDIEAMPLENGNGSVWSRAKEWTVNNKKKALVGVMALGVVAVVGAVASSTGNAQQETLTEATGPTAAEMLEAFREEGEYCNIYPTKITPLKGSYDDVYQGVDSLKQLDMEEDKHDPWSNYVEFVVDNQKEHESLIEFELPSWIDGNLDLVKSVALDTHFNGETGSFQLWHIELRNHRRKAWETLWTNMDVGMWFWTKKKTTMPITLGEFEDYIKEGTTRTVVARLVSRDNVIFNALFDYMGMCMTIEQGVAPPTVPPVPPTEDPQELCYKVKEIKPVAGKGSPLGWMHNAENLEGKEMSGALDDWYKYVEFAPVKDATTPSSEYLLEVPVRSDLYPENLVGIRAYVNYRGPLKEFQQWSLELKEPASNQWHFLLDNQAATTGWEWVDLVGTHPVTENNPGDFVTGEETWKTMTLRWMTTQDVDASQIDYVRVCLIGEFDDFPDPYAPTPRPTRSPVAEGPTVPPTGRPTFSPVTPGTCYNRRSPHFDEWTYRGGVCGIYSWQIYDETEMRANLQPHAEQGCSTIMLDCQLSYFKPEERFDEWVEFIDKYAQEAHKMGMKMVIYYPTLEIVSQGLNDGKVSAGEVFNDWLQIGLSGKENRFVGNQEHWVEEGEESAWFDPESPYTDYFIGRCRKLARTAVDGLWGDVPLYYERGASWAGASKWSAAAFKTWSAERGLCPETNGCALPDYENRVKNWDFSQQEFKYWVIWRHHSLAKFLNKVRIAVREEDPNFPFIVENYPTDYMDGTLVGLDSSYFTKEMREGMFTVYETDSTSNSQAMLYAHPEDMANQLTMRKWSRGSDKKAPTWTFAYGNVKEDQVFTLAGALAVGTSPLETKTPYLASTANAELRSRYFNWLKDHTCEVTQTDRLAHAAVLYSSPTRDHGDHGTLGCYYGMYMQSTPITHSDDAWWAISETDSLRGCTHVGQYRGASYAMQMLHTPYKVLVDVALEKDELKDIKLLWLPATTALPMSAVEIIREWVKEGGTLVATGEVPAKYDEYGRPYANNPLLEVFDRLDLDEYTSAYFDGVAYFNKNLDARDFFTVQGGSVEKQSKALDTIEPIIRIHVPDVFVIPDKSVKHVFVEVSDPFNNKQHVYLMNYLGMSRYNGNTKLPAARSPQTIKFFYRAPEGKIVSSYSINTPDAEPAWKGDNIQFQSTGSAGWIEATVVVDAFSVLTFEFEDAPVPTSPQKKEWTNEEFATVSQQAMEFIQYKMRNLERSGAWKYGVFTNYVDTTDTTPLYAYGHHTTAEHMGLVLRAATCMANKQFFQESVEYVEKIMVSPLYKMINWAIETDKQRNWLSYDGWGKTWWSATAPLDDLRTILGMLEGATLWQGQEKTRKIAIDALRAFYWTSISDRYRLTKRHQKYPNGLIGISFNWQEANDDSLDPPAVSTGRRSLYDQNIAVNYQDINLLLVGCEHVDPRFCAVVKDAVELMLQAQVPSEPGLYYNSYLEDGSWSGDWEWIYTGATQHKHLKTIQEFWTAIHLAQAGTTTSAALSEAKKLQARTAADRTFEWFKRFYQQNGKRIPEYLTVSGKDVPACPGTPMCLDRTIDNSFVGEPRIYALFVRLGWILGKDATFLSQVIQDKIIPDRVTDGNDPRFGSIGPSALSAGREKDADAWNSLESVLTICKLQTDYEPF